MKFTILGSQRMAIGHLVSLPVWPLYRRLHNLWNLYNRNPGDYRRQREADYCLLGRLVFRKTGSDVQDEAAAFFTI